MFLLDIVKMLYFVFLAITVLTGIWIFISGRLSIKQWKLNSWKAKVVGILLLLPIISLATLVTYDPFLYSGFYIVFGRMDPIINEYLFIQDHVVGQAGYLLPICLILAALWIVANHAKMPRTREQ